MPTMTKRVNIKTTIPVRNITPPLSGTCKDIIMTTGDILKCLCKRAVVEEILPDGTTIKLNMHNYYTDNGAGLYVTRETKQATVIETDAEKAEEENSVETSDIIVDDKKEEEINNIESDGSNNIVEVIDTVEIVEEPETIQEEISSFKEENKKQQYNKKKNSKKH